MRRSSRIPGLLVLLVLALTAGAMARASSLQPRLANGVASASWPEVAALLASSTSCTATLAGCRTLVTAAHCVCVAGGTGAPCEDGAVLDPADAIVFLPQAGFFRVGAIHVPPSFAFGVQDDVALIELDVPVRGIRPRRINELARPPLGTPVTLVGFGRPEETLEVGVKRAGAAVLASCAGSGVPEAAHLCWDFLAPIGPAGIDSNLCAGDSGGPMLADLGAGTALVGVHSGGNGICHQPPSSSFDTDVFVTRAWLRGLAGTDLDAAACSDGAEVGGPGATTVALGGAVAGAGTHAFDVPPGTKLLRVGLNGQGFGDADLYVQPGAPPVPPSAACSSAFLGSYEACELADPAPGTWWALVDVAGASVEYQLTVTLLAEDPAPPLAPGARLYVPSFASDELAGVDPAGGRRAMVSSRLRGAGPDFASPEGVALDRDGTLLVTNPFGPSLLRVDPATGARSVVSGCPDAACASPVGAGPGFLAPRFVALEADGSPLVADRSDPGVYAIVRVDRATGARSVVSGCTSPACTAVVGAGPPIGRLFGIALDAAGTIHVADGRAVYRIDPASGDRTLLSGCPDAACTSPVGAGPAFGEPADLVFEPGGALLVAYRIEGARFGALRRIDPATGARTLVSGCEDLACSAVRGAGPGFEQAFGLGLDAAGVPLVTDAALDAVLRVDPASGDRTLLSGCGDRACASLAGAGPRLAEPLDVVLVPEPAGTAPALAAAAALAAGLRHRRRMAARRPASAPRPPGAPRPRLRYLPVMTTFPTPGPLASASARHHHAAH